MLWTETPEELAAALLLCLVSSVRISPREQGLSAVGWPPCLSIPDTAAASLLHAGFSPKTVLFSSLRFYVALIPFDFPPSDKHLKRGITQQGKEQPQPCSQHV